ncbi:hypothetical protein F4782DRAFT_496382, partial [Xylaria castorea]
MRRQILRCNQRLATLRRAEWGFICSTLWYLAAWTSARQLSMIVSMVGWGQSNTLITKGLRVSLVNVRYAVPVLSIL